MKKTILLAGATAILLAAGISTSQAHYKHDKKGWYDEHNTRHAYIYHNHHHGYWDTDDKGVRLFINID